MSSPELSPLPARIGPYEIVGRVARGGMAEVLAARALGVPGVPRVCALKRPRPDMLDERRLIDMFLDEARLVSAVRSPYCIDTYAVGTDAEGLPFIVMPLVVGVSLHRLLARGGALHAGVVAALGAQIAEGLHHAHVACGPDGAPLGIVHRDVSPHNVLVGIDGAARVADFGVAHAYSRITKTRTGQLKGKLGYLSPEQIQGGTVDPRSDVFALGIVLWELISGRRLVRAKTFAQAYEQLLSAPFPDVRTQAAATPDRLAEIVARALARDPAARWQDAATMAEELIGSVPKLAGPREIEALVRTRAGRDVEQLEALADTAARGDTWSFDITALPSEGEGSGSADAATQVADGIQDRTIVSGPPSFAAASPPGWAERIRSFFGGRRRP